MFMVLRLRVLGFRVLGFRVRGSGFAMIWRRSCEVWDAE